MKKDLHVKKCKPLVQVLYDSYLLPCESSDEPHTVESI